MTQGRTLLAAALIAALAVVLGAQSAPRDTPLLATHDAEAFGPVSPDGRHMILRSNGLDVAVRDLASGAVRTLAIHDDTGQLGGWPSFAWSKNGADIAYVWCLPRPGSVGVPAACEIRVISAAGGTSRVVLPTANHLIDVYEWSPDNRRILARLRRSHKDAGRFAVVDAENGQIRDLAFSLLQSTDVLNFENAISPDGRYVAYTRTPWQALPYDSYQSSDIHLIDLDEGTDAVLLGGAPSDRFAAWLPQGGFLFTSDRTGSTDLWRMSFVNGKIAGEPTLMTRDVGDVISSTLTAGGRFYYQRRTHRSWDVRVVNFDPAAGRAISVPASLLSDRSRRQAGPVWSPDGKFLAYRSGPAKPAPTFVTDGFDAIVVRTIASGDERSIALKHSCLADWHYWDIAWSPAQDRFLMSIIGSGPKCRGPYSVDATSGAILAMDPDNTAYIRDVQVMPDGRSLLFARRQTVVVVDPATQQERTVVDLREPSSGFEGGSVSALALSTSTGRAAMVVQTLDKQSRLAELNVTTGRLRVIQEEVGGWNTLAWTADDRYLLYFQQGDSKTPGDIWRVPVEGGRPERLGVQGLVPGDQISHIRVHPAGRMIAFQLERPGTSELFRFDGLVSAAQSRDEENRP